MVSASEVRELLDERPDLEPAVEAVLDADPPWDFHDVDVDSGRFGELVAKGVVEKTDEGYRVPDREAVDRALAGEVESTSDRSGWDLPELSLSIDRLEVAFVLGALALVVGFRLLSWPTVFRQGQLVLSGNDPYHYRYLVEQLLATPDVQLSALPSGLAHGEPLLVVTLWLGTLALGGTPDVAGHVLAWFPVVTALLTALLVYATVVLVTDDRRIGLAAVAMLAVLPGHAMRTSLGFADHHAFDYLWLAVTLFGVVLVVTSTARRDEPFDARLIVGVATISLGVTAQTLAWDNSPLILVVLGPYLALEALRSVHSDESPLRTTGPHLVGIVIAAGLVWAAHFGLGWHTPLVAAAPTLLAIGGLGVLVAGEMAYRFFRNAPALIVIEIAGLVTGAFAMAVLRPQYWEKLVTSIRLRLLAPQEYVGGLSIFGETLGWLLLFGFLLLLAMPYLVWATHQSLSDARWLPPVVFGWYFFSLTGLAGRFVGAFSPSVALFAGLALVHLAERVDLARRPAPFTAVEPPDLRLPESGQASQLVVLFLLVASLSIVQVPVKTSHVTTPPELADTALYLADDSDERNLTYPDNYVFSGWSRNRVYNYFVNGESRSYGYARSNYVDFLASGDSRAWYDRLNGRAGYVVVTPRAIEEDWTRLGRQLFNQDATSPDAAPGLAHYRLVYVSATGRYKAFALVPGAVLRGQAEPNAVVNASTAVEVPGASFTYTRETRSNGAGNFSLRVAYPGTYEVDGRSVTVTEAAIRNGSSVRIPD